MGVVSLREVEQSDLDLFFEFSSDPMAYRMVAFTADDPHDRNFFNQRWQTIVSSDDVCKRTVIAKGQVVGNMVSFIAPWSNQREVGYWFGRQHWGKGYATEALTQFLRIDQTRPLHARTAFDNIGSLRVLQKCGFQVIGKTRTFAESRGDEIEESILRLDESVLS